MTLRRALGLGCVLAVLAGSAWAVGSGATREKRPALAVRDVTWGKGWGLQARGAWGLENVQVLAEPAFRQALRVRYPQGSASPTLARNAGRPLGGAQFYAELGMTPSDRMHLRYYVRFPEEFDFVKGGKLPGLYGGSVNNGRRIPDGTNGFSTRLMWRARGDGEVYAYMPSSRGRGTSLGRGNWRFTPGRWHLVEQELVLNRPGYEDGEVRIWIDERLVLERQGLVFRSTDALKIEGVLFSTFFGGADESWATPADTHVDFAELAVAPAYIGPARGAKGALAR